MRLSKNLESNIPSDTSSGSMYESSGSQFFRTTTGIQSRPDAFEELRLVMTFLINLAVLGILCSFTLVLEGKAGKDIPVSSRLEKTFDSEEKTSAPLNKEVNSRFTFAKNSFSNSPKVTQVKFRESDRYFWFISVFTFDSLKNYFLQQSLACLNFTLDVEDLFCWYKRKKWFLWAIAAAQTAEKDG